MAIISSSTSPQPDGTVLVNLAATPNSAFDPAAGTPKVISATVAFSATLGVYPAPQNLAFQQDPATGRVTATGTIDPRSIKTGVVYYLVIVKWSDLSVDNPGDNAFAYNPPAGGGPATALGLAANPPRVGKNQPSAVTATASAAGSPAPGRTVNFSLLPGECLMDDEGGEGGDERDDGDREGHEHGRSGQHHGHPTLNPVSATTDPAGNASSEFSADRPGRYVVQASCDGLISKVSIEVRGH